MRMKQRILSFLICVCMIITQLPMSAFAEDMDGSTVADAGSICEECSQAKDAHTETCSLYTALESPVEVEPKADVVKDCTCGAIEATHGEGCPLYTATENSGQNDSDTDAVKDCTCGTLDAVHGEGCPLYTAPAALGQCICTEKCQGDTVNAACPVCSVEGADLAACKGTESVPMVKAIAAWEWIDDLEMIDPDTNIFAPPGAADSLETVIECLPGEITATIGENKETIKLEGWSCPDFPEGGAGSGSFVFAASLPEGYALAEGVPALEITLRLGDGQIYTTNMVTAWSWNAITNRGRFHEDYMCATSSSWQAKYAGMTSYLPKSITATVDGESGKTINLENWICTSPTDATAFAHGGIYTFTAKLESPYILSDGSNTVTLKVYGDGWYLNSSTNTMPAQIGWNEDHMVYTINSQDNYPIYNYDVYGGAYKIYLADGNKAVLNTTDTTWNTYNAKFENQIAELFTIVGSTATITGRKDTTYVTPGFTVSHSGDTTIYLNDYQITSRKYHFSGNEMTLFSASEDQTVTIVYSGICRLPVIKPSSSGNKKLIFKPKDEKSVLYIERLNKGYSSTFSVEFDDGKVYVESGMNTASITVRNGCDLTVTGKVEGGDNFSTFQANTILIDNAKVAVSAEGRNNNFSMYTMMGSAHKHNMVEGSSITIQNQSSVTVDSSNAPLLNNSEFFFTGIGNAETITIMDSTVVVKQRNTELSSLTNYNEGTDASIGNVFKTLTIKNSTVTSDAYYGAAIGMGGSISMKDMTGTILIEDSRITATSGYGAAIGIGYGSDTRASVNVTIKGSSNITARSVNGAGIGGSAKHNSGIDPDSVVINPSIPGGWESVDGGSIGTFSLRSSSVVTPIVDSNYSDSLYTAGQTLTVMTSDSGTPSILAESGVLAIAGETVTTDVTIVQNTTKTAAAGASVIKVGEAVLGTLREDFKSIAATMPSLLEDNYSLAYGSYPMVNWKEAAGPLYQAGPYAVTAKTFNRFWAEPQQELGGTVYITNSSSSNTKITSARVSASLYTRVNNLTPASAAKSSPTPDKLIYQWYKDGVAMESKTSYSLLATAPGVYYCVVTGGNLYSGSVTSNTVTVYTSDTTIPAAPQLDTKDKTSITIKAPNIQDTADTATYEYSIDGGASWQDGLTFTGLEQNTSYSIIRRVKDIDDDGSTATPGPASAALVEKTIGDTPDAEVILAAIDYEKECFDSSKLPANVSIYKAKSVTVSNRIDAALEGSLTSYIADYGKAEKVLYAKFADGSEWTMVTIPARPAAPAMYPEDILASADSIMVSGTRGVVYNYAKTGETPDTNNAVICDADGTVTFTGLTSDTAYTLHARVPSSNTNKHFHSAQTSISGKTLSVDGLVTTIYIPAGQTGVKEYDLAGVLGDKTFDSLWADGTVISTASANEQTITLTPAANASGSVTLMGTLADSSTINIKVIISDEVVGQNDDGQILWLWKQEDADLTADVAELLGQGDELGIGTSRRLVPIYASGVSAGKRVAESAAGSADIRIPYWNNTSSAERWLMVYRQSDGTVREITPFVFNRDGIELNKAASGVYGLYTVVSTYVDIPVEVSLSGVYGSELDPTGIVTESGYIPSGKAQWSYTYSTDGGENYSTYAPKKVGTYYVKAVFLDPVQERRGETILEFEISKAPLSVTAKDHTITYGDDPANNGVDYDGFVNGETEEVLDGILTYEYSYTKGEDADDYTITPKGLTADNYDITFNSGKLTVGQAIGSLTANLTGYTKTFGDPSFGLGLVKIGDGAITYSVGSSKDIEGNAVSDTQIVTVSKDGMVTIRGAGSASITASMAATNNYTAARDVTITVTVDKAKAPTVGEINRVYAHTIGGLAEIDLAALLPQDRGRTIYSLRESGAAYISDQSVSAEGRLTYTVGTNGAIGDSTSITVTAAMANYESATIIINITLKDRITVPEGIWIAGITDQTYTGSSIKQNFEVYDGERLLTEKTDYTVSYKNNKHAYTYLDEDYAAFEESFSNTGKKVKTGTFHPAKAPQITIKMKGNYSGSKTIYFKIEPADITSEGVETSELTVTYSGRKQTPKPTLTWKGRKLKYGTDFYIPEYDEAKKDKTAFTDPQVYTLNIVGKKNFTGKIPITLTISSSTKQIAMNKVTVKGILNQKWTGEQIRQTGFTVKYGGDILTEEQGDYTISWGANQAVGRGTVTFTGTGADTDGDGLSYIGTKTVSFKITGTAMSKVSVLGVEAGYSYTGAEIKPTATLVYQADRNAEPVSLSEGTHYQVEYQKNVEKGTAVILFIGLESGGYTGTKKHTFRITAARVDEPTQEGVTTEPIEVSFKETEKMQEGIYVAPYQKGGVKPEIIVTRGGKVLTLNKDYSISYANHKQPALSTDKNAPSLTIRGKGNFSGTKTVYFTITPKALTNENGILIVAKDKVASTKKNGYRQSFKVYDSDGRALGGADYDTKNVVYTLIETQNEDGSIKTENRILDRNSTVPANSLIRITVQGKGIYAGGEATGTYRILEKNHDISKATIQISNQEYTGNPVLITKQSQFKTGRIYIKIDQTTKRVLTLGEDIEVVPGSYVKNVKKGTAKVTFRGINEFGGTKTVSYRIGSRSISDFWKGVYAKLEDLFGQEKAD